MKLTRLYVAGTVDLHGSGFTAVRNNLQLTTPGNSLAVTLPDMLGEAIFFFVSNKAHFPGQKWDSRPQ